MAIKKVRIKPPGYTDIVHPETSADVVIGYKKASGVRFIVGTSTAGWTLQDCDYLCDGTNDQVEINNAITALPATGGEIVILDGTYNITAKIDVNKSNVSIRGNGNASVLSGYKVFNMTSVSNCKITNLCIYGKKTAWGNEYDGIYVKGCDSIVISDNTIKNTGGSGVNLYDTNTNCVVENNYFDANYYGAVYLNGWGGQNDHCIIRNNYMVNGKYGIYMLGQAYSDNFIIKGNIIKNSELYGMSINKLESSVISNNIVLDCVDGIRLTWSLRNLISNNICIRGTGQTTDYASDQHTIFLSGTSNGYNLISSNMCMGKAVTNEGGTGNTLVNNKFDAT